MITSKNPATGEENHRAPDFNPAAVTAVVDKARHAQESGWGRVPVRTRLNHIIRANEFLFKNIDAIARDISKNNGKPLVEGLNEVIPVTQTIGFVKNRAARALRDQPVRLGAFLPTKKAYIAYRPMGVVGIISPWNYPLSTPMVEVILALTAGNAVVLKPSEVTGLVNEWISRIVGSMKLPEGIFTLLPGKGEVGAALASSRVDRLILTGSVATGKKVMAAASQNLTPVTLELGGKDCMIVLEDADLEVASAAAVVGGFYNTGQTCCSIERLLIHESIAEPFLLKMGEKLRKLRMGESQGCDVELGSITFEGQKKTYFQQLQDHLNHNGKTLFGVSAYDGRANFMSPLLVEAADDRMFWKNETFGPVVAVKRFSTTEEAIKINNDSPFGLTAVIWTKNQKKAREMAKHLNVGTVVINDAPFTNAVAALPWGGVRESGIGRVHGEMGLRDLCHAQVVTYDLAGQVKQMWWYPYSEAHYGFMKNITILLGGTGFFNRLKAFFLVVKTAIKMGPRL
jgi:acyl-CoA reductase-like NAD-dependent aldehyde dehydrogenase